MVVMKQKQAVTESALSRTRYKKDMEHSKKETEERMTAALRGARVVGHRPMKPTATQKRRAKKPKKKLGN